jgi:hypothetical protein
VHLYGSGQPYTYTALLENTGEGVGYPRKLRNRLLAIKFIIGCDLRGKFA